MTRLSVDYGGLRASSNPRFTIADGSHRNLARRTVATYIRNMADHITFRNLSYWGILKVTLILDFLIPILFFPIFLVMNFKLSKKFGRNWPPTWEWNGLSWDWTTGDVSGGATAIIMILVGIVWLFIQSAILYFFAQKTPVGKIRIG